MADIALHLSSTRPNLTTLHHLKTTADIHHHKAATAINHHLLHSRTAIHILLHSNMVDMVVFR
jgi:hypothetical protein